MEELGKLSGIRGDLSILYLSNTLIKLNSPFCSLLIDSLRSYFGQLFLPQLPVAASDTSRGGVASGYERSGDRVRSGS